MKDAARMLAGVAGVWVLSWLSLGCLVGQPTLLLHPLQAGEGLRVSYLMVLYLGLMAWMGWLWKAHPPRVAWGWTGCHRYWVLSLFFFGLHRLSLWAWWSPAPPSRAAWISALLLAPVVAMVEELVFRGYLYGVLRQSLGVHRAALMVSLLFALVHLFRPGDLAFKLALALGLVVASLVLITALEAHGLAAAAAVHSAWITGNILDPPGHMLAGWWSGLHGEPAAGVSSWLLLGILGGFCWRMRDRNL